MEKLCVIFGAGEVWTPRKSFGKDALIIAADGGYSAAKQAGLSPHAVVGDFDSGDPPESEAFVIKLNRDKDDTDMLAAAKLGLRREYKTFVIYGGVGGRADHTAANIALLRYLNNFGAHGYLVFKDMLATVITEESFALPRDARGTVSVFAYGGDATGVSYQNLSYILKNATLTPDYPLGVSNAITAPPAKITVRHGSLLVYFAR